MLQILFCRLQKGITYYTRTHFRIQLLKVLLFFLEPNLSTDPQISGSLDIPLALSELRKSKFDPLQDIEVYRTANHDFFSMRLTCLSFLPLIQLILISLIWTIDKHQQLLSWKLFWNHINPSLQNPSLILAASTALKSRQKLFQSLVYAVNSLLETRSYQKLCG